MNFVEVKKKENLGMKNMGNNFLASNNIKKFALNKNTDGTSEIQACGDRELSLSMKQEAPTPLGLW